MYIHNTYCNKAISPSQGIQSLYSGKQMSLTAILVTTHCRNFLGFGAEYECEDVAQTVGTTILFRRIYSGDVKSASEKCWLHTTIQVVAL
jgi:hypothetical protein